MLKRCLVSLHGASGLQVNFEYERLPTSSHWHGIIYHGDRLFCPSMKQRKLQYGLWLWVVRYAGRHSPWWSIISSQSYVGNWPEIPNLWETKKKKKKKIEKTHAKENNHTHKTIFTWFDNLQFVYVYGVVRISLLSGKNTKCCYSVSVSQKTTTMTTIKP